MIKTNTILISVGIIIIILILSVFNTISVTTLTQTNSPLICDPAINLTKNVKENNNWVKHTSVNIGDTVQFKLLINNTGDVVLTNVITVDDLPDFLTFNNDANITPASFNDHHIEWHLGTLAISESKEIIFSAQATASGDADNFAIVTTNEGETDDDTSYIIVTPQGDLRCTKTVWDPDTLQWVKQINADLNDTVRFNITFVYTGSGNLTNIKIVDTLPDCLEYAKNASRVEDGQSNNIIFWNLSEILTNEQSISIEFNTSVISNGTNTNTATITGYENCITLLSCEDNATVIVRETPPPDQDLQCEKKVWNQHTQQWTEEINAEIGDTVRFNITLTYNGDGSFLNIYVTDRLPASLEYANNADPVETAINNNIIFWNFSDILTYGQSISIEFDALVLSLGVNINTVNISGYENSIYRLYCEDTATVIVEATPSDLECEKKVWDKDIEQWVEQISVDIGDTVRFNITFTYNGNSTFLDIHVKDILPVCLQYANNASPLESGKNNTVIFWNLSDILTDGQSVSIEFDALAISSGTNINTVNITGYERCIYLLSCEDTATVIVAELPPPGDLECEKKVWDPDMKQWVEEINVDIGDTVRFNITFTYNGSGSFSDIHVKDILPVCLQYANNASPLESGKNNTVIFWNLSDILTDGQSVSIEFDALAISSGTNINTVNITGYERCIYLLSCEDTATVIVAELPLQCEKKVWDPDMKQWVEEINAEVGDTVRFKITVSYWDSLAFYNIWINDTLPTCLRYNNNATPFNPVINGKEVSWYLVFYLKYGQNVSLEFDALIISDGKNINMVNVSGWKCGIQRLFCEDTATVLVEKQPDPLVANAGGPYSGYVSESIQMIGSATGGVSPYSYAWDLNNDDVYDDAVGINPTHTWGTPGIYTIRLKVTDTRAINDTDIAQVTVDIRNTPPNTPSIPEGSESGRTKRVLTYSSRATDPDGNMIYLLFDWGDGNTSGWLGPFISGSSHEANHTWTVKGTYSIKVKAKDTQGEESLWSNPLTITVTRSFSAPYLTIFENLRDRFPTMENLLTALLNLLESMRLNPPL